MDATHEQHDLIDGRVHHQVISSFVRRGHAPVIDEIASELGTSAEEARGSLRRLHDGHGLVLHPDSFDVWIAHPFSASPTAVWVASPDRGWWAPCLWCATGIVALGAPAATIQVHIGGEQAQLTIEIENGAVTGADPIVHFAVPPRDAWTNVVHWCSTVLPFHSAGDIDAWCERHRLPRGVAVRFSTVLELGRVWYGRHLDHDWRKWSVAEAQAIFDRVGLTGEFWRLPVSDERF